MEKLGEKEGDNLAIFTDMNVDKHYPKSKTLPKSRVVYLNSSASKKPVNLQQNQRIAQSKS